MTDLKTEIVDRFVERSHDQRHEQIVLVYIERETVNL